MKTILIKLGIRSSSVGVATLQTKGDIIAAALERDRFLRDLESPCSCSHEEHDHLSLAMSEAG